MLFYFFQLSISKWSKLAVLFEIWLNIIAIVLDSLGLYGDYLSGDRVVRDYFVMSHFHGVDSIYCLSRNTSRFLKGNSWR